MHEIDLLAYPIVFADEISGDRYGGVANVVLESYRYVPRGLDSDTVMIFMHPIGGLTYLPFLRSLARAGVHVISCGNRYRGNDNALVMEKVLIDLGHCVRHARETLGYNRVVIGGWSGGGAMSLYYQQQAERPTVTSTPAGDPIDIVGAKLSPGDAMLLIATHTGRHHSLTEFLDPSIVDVRDPRKRDSALDLYDPANPNKPPYSADFLVEYSAAQVQRNRRITETVRAMLAEVPSGQDQSFVVHGTMAAPKWLDPTIDPNDRRPRWCFMGDPELVNMAPAGLARYSSLRSWLSQWSLDDARADGPRCAADVSVPVLVVTNSADDACTPAHSAALLQGFGRDDIQHCVIQGATHYYISEDRRPMEEATATVSSWLQNLS